MTRWPEILVGTLALIAPVCAFTKPIAFANGTTVMLEYGAGTMWEAQIFYAPQYNYSVGGGHVEFDSDITTETVRITYARLNYLLHRWNLESAQANVFVWGGAGAATGNTFSGTEFAVNAGAQADYETRWVSASLKTDLQKASSFSIRVDTLLRLRLDHGHGRLFRRYFHAKAVHRSRDARSRARRGVRPG